MVLVLVIRFLSEVEKRKIQSLENLVLILDLCKSLMGQDKGFCGVSKCILLACDISSNVLWKAIRFEKKVHNITRYQDPVQKQVHH